MPIRKLAPPDRRHGDARTRDNPAPANALMTISDFCRWSRISERRYYEIRKDGLGPDEIRFGPGRGYSPRISMKAAEEWAERMRVHAKSLSEEG